MHIETSPVPPPPPLTHTRAHTHRAALSNTGLVLPMMFSPTQKRKNISAQSATAKLLSNTSEKQRSLELEDKVDKKLPTRKKAKNLKKLKLYTLYLYLFHAAYSSVVQPPKRTRCLCCFLLSALEKGLGYSSLFPPLSHPKTCMLQQRLSDQEHG